MSPGSLIAAEKRQAQISGVAGTIQIGETRYKARLFTERGTIFQMEGGGLQTRKLSAIVLCSLLPATVLLNDNGDTRPQEITHIETSTRYRIDTGGVDRSPQGVYWTLEASQPSASKT